MREDPMETQIAEALAQAGVDFVRADQDPEGLDFRCGDVFIEVKQFHSARIADQMARAPNVIAVQGKGAVDFFVSLCRRPRALHEAKAPGSEALPLLTPNPGSPAALAAGCLCPIPNGQGNRVDGRWVYTHGCPVHQAALERFAEQDNG